jgi:phospholipid/cholesterol/gamma-HCH transport system ATP-binding protein
MFYDEPTTGLDPVMSGVIDELILQTQERRRVTSVVVTHDMTTVRRVADRVVMLYPLARLAADESQIVFEGSCEQLFESGDPRVSQFVRGDAGSRRLE